MKRAERSAGSSEAEDSKVDMAFLEQTNNRSYSRERFKNLDNQIVKDISGQIEKSTRRMPWHMGPKKDA